MHSNIENLNINKKPELKLSSVSFIPKSFIPNNIENKEFYSQTNKNNNNFAIINPNHFVEKNKFDNENYNKNPNSDLIENENIINLLKDKKPIKISLDTNVKNTISAIVEYLESDSNDTVYLTGLNFAISKVILIAEIVKIKIKNLHQINNMDCLIANNAYKIHKSPDEADNKMIPKFEIVLTKIEPFEKGLGYQKPLTDAEIKVLSDRYLEKTTQKIKDKIIRRDYLLAKKIGRLRLIPKRKRKRVLRLKNKESNLINKRKSN